MSKVFVRKSTAIFGLVIIILIMLSVGLIVMLLKGQINSENSSDPSVSSHRISLTTTSTITTNVQSSASSILYTESENDITEETSTQAGIQENVTWESFRLPKHIIPLHYDLLLYPNLKNDTFSGSVNITVNVTKQINNFITHAYRLIVSNTKVYKDGDPSEIGVKKSFLYDPNEFFVIQMESDIQPGVYHLSLIFTGNLVGSIVGFYKSRYRTSATNETRYLATSKFQPTYARRAFPCFDEPTFKSTFTVSLVHERDYIALSNMPARVSEPYHDGSLIVTKFEKSVPMVTYLACFIVCDFDYRRTTTAQGKEFRVYATRDHWNNTEYALNFGSKVLDYFEGYFGIGYSLPKQDMVAIPDFVSGAMEHWGVITFRETNLLYDSVKSSPQNKQWVSSVISHEMAHMWFGNLVTMEWWDDLWLNEGFASYVEYKGVHEQHPEWDMLEQFVTEDMQPVMDLDSTMSSHPIVQPVSHPDEITEIFDDISYNKGASVLRMLEFFVGKENFRNGISKYLHKYQFKNAKTDDLWKELSEAGSQQDSLNISAVMKTWTQQMGFPYITVRRNAKNWSQFKAKQRRFVKNRDIYNQMRGIDKDYVWSVPLSYITSNGHTGIVWLHNSTEEEFEIPVSEKDWVKFNVNQTGYYIVNYQEREWEQMINLLKTNHEVLSPSDRSNLLFDTFLLAEAGHIKYDILLSMTMYLKNETHLVPWETAYACLVYLSQLLEFSEVNLLVKSYIKDITKPLYEKLGWEESEEHLDNLLRTTIIGLACHSGNQDCLNEASALLQNWIEGYRIPTTLRRLVYHYGMAEIGREEHWNYMWTRYLEEDSPQERKTLLYGLAHVRIPSLIHRYLDYAMDDTKIRRQDFFSILSYLAGNPIARPFVWKFLRDKWKALVERYTLNDRYLGLAVKKICSYFTSEFELREMKSFFEKYPDAGAGKRRRQQALENVQNNIKWLQDYKEGVKSWLQIEGPVPWLHTRLPSHIIPRHYDLMVHPEISKDHFTGTVSIEIQLQKSSAYILLHLKKVNITKTELTDMINLSSVSPSNEFHYENNDYWVIQFSEKLSVGTYKLNFEFEGDLKSNSYNGLYKSSYTDPETKEKRYFVATQFESTHARRAFPCFDEPSFKSTFTIRLRHESQYVALSNTLETETVELEDGLQETRFERSVPMVTYLACLIVGDFNFTQQNTETGIRLRVYATPHNVDKTIYALETGEKLFGYFEKYFNTPYPLKKLDMVAIPGFQGGMENWGIITYGESRLLVSQNESSLEDIVSVARIISHEIAHMWFGNLVTMKWWDELWLNEGFASYMHYKGIQYIEPSWQLEEQFVFQDLYRALSKDGSTNSHPIVQSAHSSFEISEMFDSISYNKGSSILRMLENLMGNDFRIGVSAYLKKYAFQNARTEDLWTELSLASRKGLNVTSLMDTWTRQMNYPYITVKQENDGKVSIQQHHFVSEPENKVVQNPSPYGYIWKIPIAYHTSEEPKRESFVLLNSSNELILEIPNIEWIKLNVNFFGYFLVNYNFEAWNHFSELLVKNHLIFSQTDRANLLYDSFALAKAGLVSYEVPLNMTSYLRSETDIVPWKVAHTMINNMKSLLENDLTKEILKEYVKTVSKNIYKSSFWHDKGNYIERTFGHQILEIACDNENYDCLKMAADLLVEWRNGEKLNPNLRRLVYFYGMRATGDEATWKYMWDSCQEESSSQERLKLLNGLSNVRNVSLLKELIEFAQDENKIRRSEYFIVLKSIARNSQGFGLVSDFVFKNWPSLVERFTLESRSLGMFVKAVFGSFHTEETLKLVQNFFRKYPKAGAGKRSRRETIESIQNNIKWIQKYETVVRKWLTECVYMPWKAARLPRHVVPSTYDIEIHPNISTETFQGKVLITTNISESEDYIILHSNDVVVSTAQVQNSETKELVKIVDMFPFQHNTFWVFRFAEKIPTGPYNLIMEFSGKILSQDDGLVKTSYTNNITKEERFLLYTQFEPTYARRMFPCFDEPSMKSKFRITVVHDQEYFAISNMPEVSRRILPTGLMETKFSESVPMSTYLVCIVVSDFSYTETTLKDGKKMRYYAAPDRVNKTLHTLNITPEMLQRYEEFFNIPYALPKLDFASIPGFGAGGMENWGLVLYPEDLLIDESTEYDDIVDSDKIVAHELAHQWFGNLVTMSWWNDIWLNEGFSTFAMYRLLSHFHPTADEIAVRRKRDVMGKDIGRWSHPIIHAASNTEEINSLFDRISYEKGCAVLTMLQYVMKEDFQKGLTNYLNKYAYSNAETNDLWNELSKASKQDINITEIMNTWTCQKGFPYIKIERDETTFTAKQQRFLIGGDNSEAITKSSPFGYLWKVPLAYKNMDTGEEESYWLTERKDTFPINASRDTCIKFNPSFFGYYIIKYDETDWDFLSKRLQENHTEFTLVDRYNLLFDATQLVKADLLLYDVVLDLSKYLKEERNLYIWKLAYHELFKNINGHLDQFSETGELWQKYIVHLTEDIYDGIAGNGTEKSDLEEFISLMACSYKSIKCIQEQDENLQKWSRGENITNVRRTFAVALPHTGNESIWEQMWSQFIDNNTSVELQEQLAFGLTQMRNEELLKKTLNNVISNDDLDARIVYEVFENLMTNPVSLPILWNYVKTDLEQFYKKSYSPETLIQRICSQFKTTGKLRDIIKFFKANSDFDSETVHKCISSVQKNIEWLENHEETIENWLRWNFGH